MKNKSYYIQNFGEKVVNLARDYYETDFNKVLFVEDCKYEDDLPASEDVVSEYIMKAYRKISTQFQP